MDRAKRRKVWAEAERCAKARTNAAGHVDLVGAIKDLKVWIDANPGIQDTEHQAAEVIRRLDEARRPKVGGLQLAFFDPEAWVPVGVEGERVLMDDLTESEFDAWWDIEQQEHNVQTLAYAEKLRYRMTRKLAWSPLDPKLGAVERRAFGWP